MDGPNQEKSVWLIHAYGETEIQFTLDVFLPAVEDEALMLYPEGVPVQTNLNPTT